jgi:hypothetical protein
LDWTQPVFNVSFAYELQGSSTASFSIQFTLDDVNGTAIVPTWFEDANVAASSTTSVAGNYMFPIRAVRHITSGLSANGSAVFAVLQGLPV